MLKLIINNPQAADAVLPLRWCLTSDTIERLKDVIDKEPRLLVVVLRNEGSSNYEVDRGLLEIDQLMDYVQFSRPGKYTVYAAIVYLKSRNIDWMKIFCLSKRSTHNYEYKVFDGAGKFRKNYLEESDIGVIEHTSIDIVVGKEFFAKEPREWENKWVNIFFSTKPADQCAYRRRRILAYTLQPILVFLILIPIVTIIKLFGGIFFLLCGYRGIDFKPILHPLRDTPNDVWYYRESSIFVKDKDGNQRPFYYILFAPIVWIGLFVFSFLTNMFLPYGILFLPYGIPMQFVVFSLSFIVVVLLLNKLQSITIEMIKLHELRAEEERRKRLQEERERLFGDIICDYSLGVGVKSLPKHRRTVYLRFIDLKSKVCRPFAQ